MSRTRSRSTRFRTRIIPGTMAALVMAGMLTIASAPAAFAAESKCSGDLCASTGERSTAVIATIRAWPPNYGFYGHFELQTPNGRVYNSITSTWNKGGIGNYFNNIDGGAGVWWVTAWRMGSNGWENIGRVDLAA